MFKTPPRVGILGGGQLAKMLVEAILPAGITPWCLAEEGSPCLKLFPTAIAGRVTEAKALERLLEKADTLILENEWVDIELLERFQKKFSFNVVPGLRALSRVRDKLEQKHTLKRLPLPTLPYLAYEKGGAIEHWLSDAAVKLGLPLALKWGGQGYDGKGVYRVDRADDPEAVGFLHRGNEKNVPVYAEKWVFFQRELAMVYVHSSSGEKAHYPLVISHQEQGMCDWVKGPATAFGVAGQLEEEAVSIGEQLAREIGLSGTFALEFFEVDGNLWVNEVAPRVHNTGHFSQNAGVVSQFENHWRAVLGLPLGETYPSGKFAMVNLIGGDRKAESPPEVPDGIFYHWYEKSFRTGRKLGHLNAFGDKVDRLDELLEIRKKWSQS